MPPVHLLSGLASSLNIDVHMLLLPGNLPDARAAAQEHEGKSRQTVATACMVNRAKLLLCWKAAAVKQKKQASYKVHNN